MRKHHSHTSVAVHGFNRMLHPCHVAIALWWHKGNVSSKWVVGPIFFTPFFKRRGGLAITQPKVFKRSASKNAGLHKMSHL